MKQGLGLQALLGVQVIEARYKACVARRVSEPSSGGRLAPLTGASASESGQGAWGTTPAQAGELLS